MKKIIVLLLLLSLSLSGVYAFDDVDGKYNVSAIESLNALGIMRGYGDGSFRPDEVMTRAEFAVAVTNILGIDFSGAEAPKFSDVPEDHFAAGAIAYLTAKGSIKGYSDGRFGTEDSVTCEQAIKILVEITGYGIQADSKGGYPSGYVALANETGILKGISGISYREPAKRGIIAELIYNALKVKMYVQTTFSDGSIAFEKKGTVLEEYRDIVIFKGQIIENEYTGLSDLGNTPDGAVKIKTGDGSFTVFEGNVPMEDMLGYEVEIFAKEDEGEYEAVCATLLPVNKTVIYGEDIISVKDGKILYTKRGEHGVEYETRLDFNYDLIYNGIAKYDFNPNELMSDNAYIELIDTDDSGRADVVFLNCAETVIFDKYHKETGIIKDKFSATRNINLKNEGSFVSPEVIRDGEVSSLEALKEWSVLSVYRSQNTEGTRLVKIVATSKEALLKVTSREEDTVSFGPDEYYISSDYKLNESLYGAIIPGELRRFLFNERGEIACVVDENGSGGLYYGYVAGIKNDNYEESAVIKLFLEDGSLGTYTVSDNLKVDGEAATAVRVKELLLEAKYGNSGGADVTQLVKVGFSKDGEVNRIDTAKENAKSGVTDLEASFENESVSYSIYSLGAFGGKIIFGTGTVIFNVPDDPSDNEGYKIVDYSSLGDGSYVCSGYDISKSGDSGVILIKGDIVTSIDNDSPLYVVERKTIGIRPDETVGEKYFFVGTNGSTLEGFFDENTEFFAYRSSMGIRLEKSDIEPGDVVRIVRRPNDGGINLIERMFDASSLADADYCGELTFSGSPDPLYSQSLRLVTAKAENMGISTALMSIVKPADSETKKVFWNFAGSTILHIKQNRSGNFSVESGTTDSISDINTVGEEKASVIVAKTRYGALNEVFVYDFYRGEN